MSDTPAGVELDACGESFDHGAYNTLDHEVPLLLLFAGVDLTDQAAVEARRLEWAALWPGGTA